MIKIPPKQVSNVILTLFLPVLIVYTLLSHVLAFFLAPWVQLFFLNPFARHLYDTAPFARHIWSQHGPVKGRVLKYGFEFWLTVNFLRRYISLPMRRSLPSFYIVGFPKAGTTALSAELKKCPGISGLDGLPFHPALTKESHFFQGICGRKWAHQGFLYRSFFPTVLARWWAEVVLGVRNHMAFDATPLFCVLPHVAARMARLTPGAKIVILLRDPVDLSLSSENMMRALGVDAGWSYMEQVGQYDARFNESAEDAQLWAQLEALQPEDPLPSGMMDRFYASPTTPLRVGRFFDRLQPLLKHFPKEQLLFVSFDELRDKEEKTVRAVLKFVGAEEARYVYRPRAKEVPPPMASAYRGVRPHPSVRARLRAIFRDSNLRLYRLLGVDLGFQGTADV